MRTSEKVMVATLLAILLPTAFLIGMLLNQPEKDGGLLPIFDGKVRAYIYQDANGTYYVFYSAIDVGVGVDVRIYRWNGTDWVELEAIYKSPPPLYP